MNQSNRRDISNYQRPIDPLNDNYRAFTRTNGYLVPLDSDPDLTGLRSVRGVITGLCIMGLVYGLVIIFMCV